MMIRDFSVILNSTGNNSLLNNVLYGIARNTIIPQEILLIAEDRSYPKDLDQWNLPIKLVKLDGKKNISNCRKLNHGARLASTEHLVFMDEFSVPSKMFFENLANQYVHTVGIIQPTFRYLRHKITYPWHEDHLEANSEYLDRESIINELTIEPDYGKFISSCFYIPKLQYSVLNGFDETYFCSFFGSMDFAQKVNTAQCPFYRSEAKIYHQNQSMDNPVKNLEQIVYNFQHFYDKWGYWPSTGELNQLAESDLIEWNPEAQEAITIKPKPV
ncbi:MAG: hypothetical protein CL613_00425 [Aquimarina sp.]|nr:hypothetical protein [Aquimarina sp.]